MDSTEFMISADQRGVVIDSALRLLNEHYVHPEVAAAAEKAVRARSDEYSAIEEGVKLGRKLTEDLQAVTRDLHLRVFGAADPLPGGDDDGRTQREADFALQSQLYNYGFAKVERLAGNIGYIDLRGFYSPADGGDTVVAAMALLANTNALIFDLRQNGGGDPAMVALLTSYLFTGEQIHLNSLYWRANDFTQQFWTLPYVPGKRYADKPVYVLIGERTFSGAEEFSNNLKVLKRATLVGQKTRGAANPVNYFPINGHFAALIPVGKAINPVTQTNWEGVGVEPDVAVPAEAALNVAHKAALEGVVARAAQETARPWCDLLNEARAALEELQK